MDKKFIVLDQDLYEYGAYANEEAAIKRAQEQTIENRGSTFYVAKMTGFAKASDTAPYTKFDTQPKTAK